MQPIAEAAGSPAGRKFEIVRAWRTLRTPVVAAGIGTSLFFAVVGPAVSLQMYGDGSLFSYAIAAQQAWLFHWHNISGRLFTYVFVHVPAEAVVAVTQNAMSGITLYGILFFAAPLLGLLLTWTADRSQGRAIFTYACLSTACLCPLVFGVPTEMWMAHALFWPALAVSYGASLNMRGALIRFAALLALVFTHGGAVVFSLATLLTLLLTGRRQAFRASLAPWAAAMALWLSVKLALPPDDYIAGVLVSHAFRFIDPWNLDDPAIFLMLTALIGYAGACLLLKRARISHAPVQAAFGCALALVAYWIWFDTALLAEARYELRTALLGATPALGLLAAVQATPATQQRPAGLHRILCTGTNVLSAPFVAGAIVLVLLVHFVETAKFLWAWTNYKAAVQTLAVGSAADPKLGDPLFVSSQRIDERLNRLAWNSTTPYLSVLLAPALAPRRLVVDPGATYFWLSCETALTSETESATLPLQSRALIRRYACLHR